MNIEKMEKQLDVLGAKRASTEAKLKALDADHKSAYQAAVNDPDAAEKKLRAIREKIQHKQDLKEGVDAEMHELGGQIVDARLKNYKPAGEALQKDIAQYHREAGRHISIGLAYLAALGAAPETDLLVSLKSRYPEISSGTAIAAQELKAAPIPSLVARKQEVERLRAQKSGVMSRKNMIQKIIGPYIRKYR